MFVGTDLKLDAVSSAFLDVSTAKLLSKPYTCRDKSLYAPFKDKALEHTECL